MYAHPSTYYDDPPPPPPPELPPLPPGRPPPSIMYRFGTTNSNGGPHERGGDTGFDYRANDAAPQYPKHDLYRPGASITEQSRMADNRRQRGHDRSERQVAANGIRRRNRYNSNRGRVHPKTPTADRPLLNFQRGTTPDQLAGMKEDQQGARRFLDIDDMSDSQEEEMDESEQDSYDPILDTVTAGDVIQDVPQKQLVDTGIQAVNEDAVVETGSPEKKQTAAFPKWSNPEYYTALPPPDESQRKRKDVVKLIRKARVNVEKQKQVPSQAAANDDFISFNFADEDQALEDEGGSESDASDYGKGVPGAPSGPRVPTIRGQGLAQIPGVNGAFTPINVIGPPPNAVAGLPPKPAAIDNPGQTESRKRQRSIESVNGEALRAPKRKKGVTPFSGGYVLDEWISPKPANPIPWVTHSHKLTESPGFRLHKEICDFYDFVKPREFEQVVREDLLSRLRKVIKAWSKQECELHCFGSFAAGIYLPNADMDVVVVSRNFLSGGYPDVCQSSSQMYKFAKHLERRGIADPASIEIISKAKVPLVKFIDRVTSLRVDMSFENETGLIANDTFTKWKQAYPAMPIIVTVIKQFLMMRGLNEVANGGLGGFSVTCLVTSLLQNMPRVQLGQLAPENHLGEILIEFLDLYGNQLDTNRTGIMMNPPGYFDKRKSHMPSKADRLAIIDPNKADNDISGGSKNVMLIFSRFSRAREEILQAMRSSNRASLLDWMLGGNYNNFLWQRNRLRECYDAQRGDLGPDHEDSDALGEDVSLSQPPNEEIQNSDSGAVLADGKDHQNAPLTGQQHPSTLPKPVAEHTEPILAPSVRTKRRLRHKEHNMQLPIPMIDFSALKQAKDALSSVQKAQRRLEAYRTSERKRTGLKGDPAMRLKITQQQDEMNRCRAAIFKLEYPEIVAVKKLPITTTKSKEKLIKRQYEEKYGTLAPRPKPGPQSVHPQAKLPQAKTTEVKPTTTNLTPSKPVQADLTAGIEKTEKKWRMAEKRECRARRFKQNHPDIKDVPARLSIKQAKRLLSTAGAPKSDNEGRATHANQRIASRHISRASVGSMPVRTDISRVGNSIDCPITID